MRQLSWAVLLQLRERSLQTLLPTLPVNVQLRRHAGLPVDHAARQGEETTHSSSAAALWEVEDRGFTVPGGVTFATKHTFMESLKMFALYLFCLIFCETWETYCLLCPHIYFLKMRVHAFLGVPVLQKLSQ